MGQIRRLGFWDNDLEAIIEKAKDIQKAVYTLELMCEGKPLYEMAICNLKEVLRDIQRHIANRSDIPHLIDL